MLLAYYNICLFVFLAPSVLCSYLKRATEHNLPGKSLGRIDGVETYEYEGHEYGFHLEPRTWEEAVAICQREKSYLAVLEDSYEVDFISNAMDGNLCSNTVFQNVWIGGRYFPDAERWLWDATGYELIGEPEGEEYFPPWKLDKNPEHECLSLQQDLTHKPKFVNLECIRKRRFLCEKGCTKLYVTDRGYWHPKGCLLDPADTGDICRLVCFAGMEIDGANPLTCVRSGWNSTLGINVIPDCKGPEEITDNLLDDLDLELSEKNTSLIFVLDLASKENIFKAQIELIRQLVRLFPPSESQLVGLIANGEVPHVVLSPGVLPICSLLSMLSNVKHVKADRSDMGLALRAVQELQHRTPTHDQILVLLSGSKHVGVDARKIAMSIQKSEGVIFTLGVDNFDADELITMATIKLDGPYFFGLSDPLNLGKVIQRLESAVELFIRNLNTSLAFNTSLLFILDLSTSWDTEIFQMVISFLQKITSAVPLSRVRRGGLIVSSDHSRIEIPLKVSNTCIFNKRIAKVGRLADKYFDSQSHFHNKPAAELANIEAKKNNPDGKTIAIILSKKSSTTLQEGLKSTLDGVFTVDISENNISQPIAHEDEPSSHLQITSAKKLEDAINVLSEAEQVGVENCSTACEALPVSPRGVWDGKGESCSGPGRFGTKCYLLCFDAFEAVGSNPVICTEEGWTSADGYDNIPLCFTPEEIAIKFMEKLNGTLENGIDSNLFFVLDESGSVTLPNFQKELDFVTAVVDAFPLSASRRAGLALFSDQVRILIAITAGNTCRFIKSVRRVRYRGGHTDIRKALVKAHDEIKRRAMHPQNLVFLVTDGISQTDPTEAAATLRAEGVVLFIIGVADYQQEQLEPLASIGPDGTANFFGVKSFRVFHVISQYLNTEYRAEGVDCEKPGDKAIKQLT